MARAFNFQFFAWDAVVKMTGLLMLQKYQSQQLLRSCSLFFEKVARLIQYCNPEYSAEAFDWDWASFHENILLPSRMHIYLVMQLSDTITDQVVYSIHFLLNDWNGDNDEENDDEDIISFEKFFSVEDFDF